LAKKTRASYRKIHILSRDRKGKRYCTLQEQLAEQLKVQSANKGTIANEKHPNQER
jgi:exonuclease SbcC